MSRDEERAKRRAKALEELRQFARESTREVANRLAGVEVEGDQGSGSARLLTWLSRGGSWMASLLSWTKTSRR